MLRRASFALLVLASALPLGAQAQYVAGIELTVSWANGDGMISANSHVRTELVGMELSALFKRPNQAFRGTVGPCAKRILFKYPGSRVPDARYFFADGKVIQLAPGKDGSGKAIEFESSSWPAVTQFLSEVQPSAACRGDA